MYEEVETVIWIGISPDLLLEGLDTQSLLQSDHFLEFKIESGNYGRKEAVKLEIESDGTSGDSSKKEDIDINLDMLKDEEDIKPIYNQKPLMEGDIKCDKCDKLFKLHNSLLRHKRMGQCVKKGENYVRPSLVPKTCPECKKTISGTKNLKKHRKSIHLKIKVFKHQCSQCDRGFVKSVYLTSHIESVHQQKTFYCKFCSTTFHTSAYLREHLKRQHNNTAVECYNCKAKFVQTANLDIHIESGICSEEHKEIKRQKKKKRNERRVSCSYCHISIAKYKLKKHIDNVHIKGSGVASWEKSIVCGYCDYQTPFNKKLLNHMQIMHPTIPLPNEIEM